jgi:hypothetical protein
MPRAQTRLVDLRFTPQSPVVLGLRLQSITPLSGATLSRRTIRGSASDRGAATAVEGTGRPREPAGALIAIGYPLALEYASAAPG